MNNLKQLAKEEEAFIDKCYEAYRLDWCISHGFGIEDLLNTLQKALEDDVVETGIIDSADEMAIAMENALGAITDQGLSNGTLWVCKAEFLDNEFLDKDYMEHLIDLMPDKEAGRKMYCKITGTSFDEEHLEVCTSAGVLKAYRSTDPGQPGICVMLNPSGYEEEIDMSYVSVYENPAYATSDGERPVDVSIMTYGNPYDESYTSKVLIRREDVMAALCEEKGGDGYAKAG